MLDGKKTYKVNKSELLDKIAANREEHIRDFEKAKVAHRDKMRGALKDLLQKVESGEKFDASTLYEDKLPRPRSYAKEYDKVAGLLRMSVESEVEITSTDYKHYILDEWDWKQDFLGTNSNYGVGRVPDFEE